MNRKPANVSAFSNLETKASAEPGGIQLGLVLDAGIHF